MMFSSPELILWDTMRVLAALASIVVIGVTPFALTRPMTWDQRMRFIGSALVGLAIVGAYLQGLGAVPDQWWRTVAVTVGMLLSAIGWTAHLHATSRNAPPPSRHRR